MKESGLSFLRDSKSSESIASVKCVKKKSCNKKNFSHKENESWSIVSCNHILRYTSRELNILKS